MVESRDDAILFAQFFEDGRIKPGFGGIGRLRGRSDYSEDERTVLSHFFTNIDSNVYCATDNMPGELWAQLMGQYARSDKTVRDRFVNLLRDVKEKDDELFKKGKKTAESERVLSLEGLAGLIRQEGDLQRALSSHLKEAGKWIEEYGVAYGHASLRDSGTIRMCFEGVSQRATKPVEKAREGAYQEQSTRAMPFVKKNLAVPFEIRGISFEEEMLDLGEELIEFYDVVLARGQEYLADKHGGLLEAANVIVRNELDDQNAKLPDALWKGVVKEKAFDLARSLLPQNITTSLGMTLNTRRFQDMLTEWQSSELAEVRVLGRAAQIEAMKISPKLMRYGTRSEFVASQPVRRRALYEELAGGSDDLDYGERPLSSKLIGHTPDLENMVLASILFHGSDGGASFDEIRERVSMMDAPDRRKIAESYVEGMGEHDLFDKAGEVGSVTFERQYDIGAMRDLQRQRGDRQQLGSYAVVGFHMRPEIEEMGLGDDFRSLMDKVKGLHDRMKEAGHSEAVQYVPVMANTIRHVTTKDPVQCFYEAGLRTQAAGADSYREIAKQEIEEVLELMPSFKGLIPYDKKVYPLNRLAEKTGGYIRNRKKKMAKG